MSTGSITTLAFLALAAPGLRAQPAPWGVLADYDGELRESTARPDGVRHVDTSAMIEKLTSLHVNTYVYLVWHAATDWDDLRNEFLPAAQQAGIDVWVYLVPPSECTPHCSLPFADNYVSWASQIATLSLSYSNLTAWSIDDFNANLKTFTPAYVAQMTQAASAVNPALQFLPLLYFPAITTAFLDAYAAAIDGIIMAFRDDPHANTQITDSLAPQLEALVSRMQPYGKPLMLMIYASALSRTPGPPSAAYISETVRTGLAYVREGLIGGVVTYVLRLDGAADPSSANPAHSGLGVASLSVLGGVPTAPGDYAEVSTDVAVDPNAAQCTLSFWQAHTFGGGPTLAGYHFKQLVVNGQVLWERDLADDPAGQWKQETLDLTGVLSGQASARMAFRILDKRGVSSYYATARFDDLSASGFALADPGFECPDCWTAAGTQPGLLASIDVFDPNRPGESFAAVQELYGPHALVFAAMALEDPPLVELARQVLDGFLAGDKAGAADAADALAQAASDRSDLLLAGQATLVAQDLRR